MKNYSKELQQNIEINKNKYLLLGFIIGITPFIIIMLVCSLIKGGIEFIPSLFRNTIIVFGLIVACSNAIVFKTMTINKIKKFS